MQFRYSDLVDASSYVTEGLCDNVPLRKHKDCFRENIGTVRAQKDWSKLVGPRGIYKGGQGPEYNFIEVTVPECIPGRLEIIAYVNEFAFLYDDEMEKLNQDSNLVENHQMLKVFHEDPEKGEFEHGNFGEKQIQSQIFTEMVAIDPERAVTSMKSWATFVQLAASRPRSIPFATLEEYLPYRIVDAGEMFWFGIVTFGMALTIPKHEMNLCKQLVQSAFAAISLTNDLFSWEKERDAAKEDGFPHVINAIWVIMRERSFTESEAKSLCREKIKYYVVEYLRTVNDTKKNLDISSDLRTYIEAIVYSLSGNVVWSKYCPRYHSEALYYDTKTTNDETVSMNCL